MTKSVAHHFYKSICCALTVVMLASCTASPPRKPDNICSIFEEYPDWYDAALETREKWGAPIHIPMAIIHQESGFVADAAPPMEYFLWIIPIGRKSDAFGYPQAKDAVWGEYLAQTDHWFADRDDFIDAIDFVGWYMHRTNQINKVSKWDAYNQYLNYHEGHGGFRRGSYKNKLWLKQIARKVESRSKRYSAQYWGCKEDLDSSWF
ncbi:MAG: hypothetical protein MI864_13905 [Pseudomonadales bacterium]|nr:hypothetical protein [Pseudomonadales bacterium]